MGSHCVQMPKDQRERRLKTVVQTLRKCCVVVVHSPVVYSAAIIVAVCTVLFQIYSYSWSPSASLCDVELTADEGLVSVTVPLTRIAAAETPASRFVVFERGPNVWTAGRGGKTPLRYWMNTFGRRDGTIFADFGYWKGAWLSNSRPGPFLVVFVPVWFMGVATLGIFLAFYFRLVRFRLRSLFVVTVLVAALLFLVRMRSAS